MCEDSWDETFDAVRRVAPSAPLTELAVALASRRRVRIALAGDWTPLLEAVDAAASTCAFAEIPRTQALGVLDAFTESLVPRAAQMYRTAPRHLAAALRDLRELSARVAAAIEDAYLAG